MACFLNSLKSIKLISCTGKIVITNSPSFIIKPDNLSCFSHLFSTSNAFKNENNIEVDSDFTSLKCRGFLRSVKPYTPPSDVEIDVLKICREFLNVTYQFSDMNTKFGDVEVKFKILNKCISHFNHNIPNSELHRINTVGDLISHFETPVKTSTAFDDLCMARLPPNVHVQSSCVRFHPETDTMFGGVSAYPKRSTIVTGLMYKKLYKGYKVNATWPYT